MGTATDWVAVAAGGLQSVGQRADSTLWSWGNSLSGQLGLGDTLQRNSPTQGQPVGDHLDEGGRRRVPRAGAARRRHPVGVGRPERLGSLCTGDGSDHSTPVQVGTATWLSVDADADSYHTLLLRSP